MRAESDWRPTKFVLRNESWQGSRDPLELAVSSRIFADRAAAAYARAIGSVASGDLVDLGCGKVPLYGMYRDRVTSVTCVDWPGSLHESPHLDHEADLTQPLAMFPDRAFDTVVLTDVLEHLPDPVSALHEIDRILRPEGHLVLGVPFMYWLHEEPHDYHRYTEHLLRRRALDLGHEVIELDPLGGPIELIFDVAGKVMAGAGLPPRVLAGEQWLGQQAGRALRGARRRRADHLFPTGYVMVTRKPA